MKFSTLGLTIMYIAGSMCCTVFANLLLKQGAMRPGVGVFWPLSLVNGHVVLGAVLFVFAFLLYLMVLRRMPLNVAQAIFSLQFVLVIVWHHYIECAICFNLFPANDSRYLNNF